MMRYTRTWRNKFLTLEAKTLGDMIQGLQAAATELVEMRATGVVTLQGGADDDYAMLVTEDADVAKRFGFEPEDEQDDSFAG